MNAPSLPAPAKTVLGMAERRVLLAAAFLRALATGMAGVLLGIYLARLDLSPRAVGLVAGAGLAGAGAGDSSRNRRRLTMKLAAFLQAPRSELLQAFRDQVATGSAGAP